MSAAGDRARARRVELGLSQQELGESMGTRQEAVSKLEANGPRTIRILEQLAEALDCTPWWIQWGTAPKTRRTE